MGMVVVFKIKPPKGLKSPSRHSNAKRRNAKTGELIIFPGVDFAKVLRSLDPRKTPLK